MLALATSDERILVTHNVSDFPAILRDWASAGRSHAGVILVYGIAQNEFDLLMRGILRWLELRPDRHEWVDHPAVLDRDFASGSKAAGHRRQGGQQHTRERV